MFRTSKTIALGVALLAGTAANAQDKGQDLLTSLFGADRGSPAAEADAGAQLRAAITDKIMQIATTSQRVSDESSAPVTIQDIDELNRTAEHARTELELERLGLDRMKAELESLLALHAAIEAIEGPKEAERAPEDVAADRAAQETARVETMRQSSLDTERDSLPRLIGVVGVEGNLEAALAMADGTETRVEKGEFLVEGFDVVDVLPGQVVLKGHVSGTEYNLSPRAAPMPMDEEGPHGPNQAVDMGGVPIGIF